MTRRDRETAFTLIELLVVIGIISLLMSIFLPSLSRARQQARGTVCLASLNEFMKSTTAYISDNHFRLPPAQYRRATSPETEAPPVMNGWAEALHTYLFSVEDFPLDRDFPVHRNHDGEFKFFVCAEADPRQDSTGHYRVYEGAWSIGQLDNIYYKLPLITDANPCVFPTPTFDPEDPFYRADIPKLQIAGLEGEAYIDERHYGAANYVFRDGHAERSVALKEHLALDWDLDPNTENR